jgi:release factor glutamine methyltransferase
VKDYEPKLALLGGEDGTEYYRRLAKELPNFLKSGAQVFLEIGSAQGSSIKEIFSTFSCSRFGLLKDWSDRDRFFFLEIE